MNKLLKWNPEFAKNVWLEFTTQRLIVMPTLIGLIVLLIVMSAGSSARSTLHAVSMGGIVVLGFLWGIKTSADAILDEYNEKTWDWQKMSVIGPWKLAWGKLFGSTIYNWYGTAICFVIYVLTSFGADDVRKEIQTAVLLLIGMVSVHGLMILISLQMIRKSDGRTKIKSNRIFISGIIAMGFVTNIFSSRFLDSFSTDIAWFGIVRGNMNLALVSALFYCSWIIAGLYRSMRAELQFSDAPAWWLTFMGTSFVFHYGYFVTIESIGLAGGISAAMAITFVEFLVLLYLLALSEPKDLVNFRLLEKLWKAGDRATFLRNVPLWMVTLPVVFVFGFFAVFFLNIAVTGSLIEEFYQKLNLHGMSRTYPALIAVFGFVLRDLGILVWLNLSNRSKRADSAWIVYLLVLYVLLPMLAKASELPIGAAFYPDFFANKIVMVAFPVTEAAIVLYLVRKRWSELKVE